MSDLNKVYELRFYSVEAGRDQDMRNRVQQDLKWLFPRHDIRPVGGWTSTSAPKLPLFVYITPFSDMLERNRCWNGFYTDPAWQEVRNRTNAGSELVEDYEIWFVREILPWTDVPPGGAGSLDEILFLETLVGKSGPAAQALRESEIPAYERAGATIMGVFDVISGGKLPGSVVFIRWPNWETRAASAAVLEADVVRAGRRAEEKSTYGKTLVGKTGSYLLDPVTVDWD